jgi:hypothetical protein
MHPTQQEPTMNWETQNQQRVADTILQQLGGQRFVIMTGAKHLAGGESHLQFGLPANFAKDGINKVVVELNRATDTYNVRGYKIRGVKVLEVTSVMCVYADQLQATFSRITGLDTRI